VIACVQFVGEFPGHRRNCLEQACAVVPDRLVDLVAYAQLGESQQCGLPQQEHPQCEFLFDLGARRRVADDTVTLVEQPGDVVEHLEDGLAAHFGGMSGDHRADLEPTGGVEESVAGHPRRGDVLESRPETAVGCRGAIHASCPLHPLDVTVLGGVGQQRQPVEGPHDQQLLRQRLSTQDLAHRIDVARAAASSVNGETPDLLDEFERLVTLGGADRVAEQPTEEPDVVTRSVTARVRLCGDVRHAFSQARQRAD
jgi:hypothetical protein